MEAARPFIRFSGITGGLAVSATALAGILMPAEPATAEEIIDFVITLDGDQEVPPVNTPATGSGTASLDTTTNEFSWEFEYSGLLGEETAAHFHGDAPRCANAGVQVTLDSGSPKIGSTTLTDEQADALMAGLWYVNVHSDLHPPGEIRGQVVPEPGTYALFAGLAAFIGVLFWRRRRLRSA